MHEVCVCNQNLYKYNLQFINSLWTSDNNMSNYIQEIHEYHYLDNTTETCLTLQ